MPSFPTVVKEITYRVANKKTSVVITAKVGSAQRGVPVAILDEDTDVPAKPLPDGSVQFDCGSAAKLIGHPIRVQTFVSDVNKKTNLTIVNYQIEGGMEPVFENTQKDVEKDGGRMGHFLFINFTA